MTRPHSHRHRKKGAPDERRPVAKDGTIYLGLAVIGGAVYLGTWLVVEGDHSYTGPIALGYLMAIAWLTNLYALRTFQGRSLSNFQQALARLPLRCAGYGTRGGKPLEAAHGSDAARRMIVLSVLASIVILIGLAYVLIPGIRGEA